MPSTHRYKDSSSLLEALLSTTPSAPPIPEQDLYRSVASNEKTNTKRSNIEAGFSSPLTEFSDDDFASDLEFYHESARQKKKHLPRRTKKQKVVSASEEDDDSYISDESDSNDSPVLSSTTVRPKRGRAASAKTTVSTPSTAPPAAFLARSSSVKRVVKKTSIVKQEERLIRKKPAGNRVPKTLEEASDADLMMWRWKNAGVPWEDIRQKWAEMTGHVPGHSTLSVRYLKLNENLARNGGASLSDADLVALFPDITPLPTSNLTTSKQDTDLCNYKKEVEDEQKAELWKRISDKMLAHSPNSEYNPKDLEKRFRMLERRGCVTVNAVKQEAVDASMPEFKNGEIDGKEGDKVATPLLGIERYLSSSPSPDGHDEDTHKTELNLELPKTPLFLEEEHPNTSEGTVTQQLEKSKEISGDIGGELPEDSIYQGDDFSAMLEEFNHSCDVNATTIEANECSKLESTLVDASPGPTDQQDKNQTRIPMSSLIAYDSGSE